MIDRLTAMSWLEGLAQDDWRECHSDSEVQEIARQTLALLKEQEPVCVKEDRINKCVCGNIVNRYYHPNFCGYCGKELIWY